MTITATTVTSPDTTDLMTTSGDEDGAYIDTAPPKDVSHR